MKSLLAIFRNVFQPKPTAARPRRSVQLGLEALEDRLVPSSMSSDGIHSVTQPATGGSVAFYNTYQGSGGFFEKTSQGTFQEIAPEYAVTDFSAGVDPTGHADVFAHKLTTNATGQSSFNAVEEWTQSTGWVNIDAPVLMSSFAAGSNGNLYAVGTNESLWQFKTSPHTVVIVSGGQVITENIPGIWTQLVGPGEILKVDAATQSNGVDAVVGEAYLGGLYLYIPSEDYIQELFHSAGAQFSVGQSPSGSVEVWSLATNGLLSHWSAQTGWQTVSNFDNAGGTISATTGGQCLTLNVTTLWLVTPAGSTYLGQAPVGNINEISAAGANDFCVLSTSDGSSIFWEYDPSFSGDHWLNG